MEGGKGCIGADGQAKSCQCDIAACLQGARELANIERPTHCRATWPCRRLAQQQGGRVYGNAPHHVESNSDVIVTDDSQRDAGLLQALVVAAAVYPEELVDLIEALLQLSQHINYQVLFPNRQRGHIGTLHLQHTLL